MSSNQLKELPPSLAKLPRLRSLNVSANPKLTQLPKALCQVRSLDKLTLDAAAFQYPAAQVCDKGTEAIMRFLCKGTFITFVKRPDGRSKTLLGVYQGFQFGTFLEAKQRFLLSIIVYLLLKTDSNWQPWSIYRPDPEALSFFSSQGQNKP